MGVTGRLLQYVEARFKPARGRCWGEKLAADVPDWHAREEARIRLIQSLAEYLLSIQHVEE